VERPSCPTNPGRADHSGASGQPFLSHKAKLDQFDELADEFAQLSLKDQKRVLLEVLDNNQAYVNLSDIDDADCEMSEGDKRLNRQFYGM